MSAGATARAIALAGVALAAAVSAQSALARRPRADHNEVLYLPDPRVARHLDLGLGEAWADWMHLQALLYVVAEFDLDEAAKTAIRAAQARGERPPERPPRYVWLAQLYDAITELDPHFLEAYLHGARFLSLLKRGDLLAADGGPRRAIALLEKAATPERLGHRWEIWNELGMVYYMDLQDTEQALRALKQAVARPGCPPLVTGFVARLAEGTEHDLEVYEHLQARLQEARASGDRLMLRVLEERAAQHLARTVQTELQRAADAHVAATGAPAADLAALQHAVATRRAWPSTVFAQAGGFWFDRAAHVVESRALADAEEDRRRRNLEVEVDRYRRRHGRRPATFAEILADPAAELRAVHHHPREGWAWVYDAVTGTVTSAAR